MREVGVREGKTQFSRLLREVEAGTEVVILRGGKPVARLGDARATLESADQELLLSAAISLEIVTADPLIRV